MKSFRRSGSGKSILISRHLSPSSTCRARDSSEQDQLHSQHPLQLRRLFFHKHGRLALSRVLAPGQELHSRVDRQQTYNGKQRKLGPEGVIRNVVGAAFLEMGDPQKAHHQQRHRKQAVPNIAALKLDGFSMARIPGERHPFVEHRGDDAKCSDEVQEGNECALKHGRAFEVMRWSGQFTGKSRKGAA